MKDQLKQSIIDGNEGVALAMTQALLATGASAREILDEGLLPGMEVVGARMREGECFIPEVLLSARVMQACLDLLRPHMAAGDAAGMGTVVIGTVEGDLHDIGKNLVGMLLQGAGFTVVNLGTGVTAADFVSAVREHAPQLLGMSALLTTTLPHMSETLAALKDGRPARRRQGDGRRRPGHGRLRRGDRRRRLRRQRRHGGGAGEGAGGLMATEMATPASGAAIAQERKKLKKVLHRFDLVFFTIAAFISLDTIALTAAYGAGETFAWLAFLIVVYLVPYGMIIAEMGSTFPVEGGPYVWTRMAFGRLAGSFTAVIYWGSNPVWIGGTLAATSVAAINSLILDEPMSTGWSIVVGLVVVWVTVMLSMIEMKYGKWTGIIGTVVRLLTLFIFLALVAVFLVQNGKPEGTITVSDLRPTLLGFLAVIGLLQFMFVGFELSSGAAEEMTDPQKDVPQDDPPLGPHRRRDHRLDDPRRAAGAQRRRALERRRLPRRLQLRGQRARRRPGRRSTGSSAR